MPIEPKIESSPRFSRYYTTLGPLLARPEVRAYTMLVLSFFTLSFFGYFAIKPTITTIITLRRQIKDETFVDQKLQEKINALSSSQVEYEAIKPDLGIILTALPKEAKFAGFVKSLEKISSESKVAMVDLSFQTVNLSYQEATSAAKEEPIGFTLTVSGDYSNLADFVKRLASFERLATVEKMRFATEETREEKEKGLHLILTGKTFYVQ